MQHAHAAHNEHAGHAPALEESSPYSEHSEHSTHDRHAGHDPEAFRRRFWLSLLLTIPVVAFSEMVQDWLGYSLDRIPGHEWVAPVLGTAVFLYGGPVFLRGGWQELRWRQPGMMLLISLAISVAFASSVAAEAGLVVHLDFW